MRLFDFFDKTADAQSEAVAVIHDDRTWTYRDLQHRSRQVAAALMATGLPGGSKVASWLTNSFDFFSVQIGVHRTPFVGMPVNPRSTAAECAENLDAFGAKWLFIDAQFAEHVERIRTSVPTLCGIVAVNGEIDGCVGLGQFIAAEVSDPVDVDISADDFVTLITTGGSTGRPKGVMRLSANWTALVINYRLKVMGTHSPVNLVATPLTHVAGEVAQAVFSVGGVNVILPKTNPATILEAIELHRVTTLFVPPTMLYMMLADRDVGNRDYTSLRNLMYGSAPISSNKLREAWAVFGPVMTHLYGLMEATSTVSIMSPDEHHDATGADRFGSIGRGSPIVMIDVVDEDGCPVAPGENGEVLVRGTNLCAGYESNPEATEAAFKSGWFRTGDIGFKDDAGYLTLVDRSKDIIKSGGFNVFPGEIEQVIWTHPAVQDCAVIGAPDDKWGEAVTAVVELKPGASVPEDDLIALCKAELGSIKAPKQVHVWEKLPRSNVGKVLKREIRDHFWRETGRLV